MIINIRATLLAPPNKLHIGGHNAPNHPVASFNGELEFDCSFLNFGLLVNNRAIAVKGVLCILISNQDSYHMLTNTLRVTGSMKSLDEWHVEHLKEEGWVIDENVLRSYTWRGDAPTVSP